VAGGGVAMEVEAAGGFEDALKFHEARSYHREVGQHVVGAAEKLTEGLHDNGDAAATFDNLFVNCGGVPIPFPGVLEGFEL